MIAGMRYVPVLLGSIFWTIASIQPALAQDLASEIGKLREALGALESKKYDAALSAYTDLANNSEWPDIKKAARYGVGIAWLLNDQPDIAKHDLKRALERGYEFAFVYHALSIASAGNPDDAAEYRKEAYAREPLLRGLPPAPSAPEPAQPELAPEPPLDRVIGSFETDMYPTPKMMVATTRLNIRAGPSTGFKHVGGLQLGESISVLGNVKFRGQIWSLVEYRGKDAYIAAFLLKDVEEVAATSPNRLRLPAIEPVPSSFKPGESVTVSTKTTGYIDRIGRIINLQKGDKLEFRSSNGAHATVYIALTEGERELATVNINLLIRLMGETGRPVTLRERIVEESTGGGRLPPMELQPERSGPSSSVTEYLQPEEPETNLETGTTGEGGSGD